MKKSILLVLLFLLVANTQSPNAHAMDDQLNFDKEEKLIENHNSIDTEVENSEEESVASSQKEKKVENLNGDKHVEVENSNDDKLVKIENENGREEIAKNILPVQLSSTVQGEWGSSEIEFDDDTKTLTVKAGTISLIPREEEFINETSINKTEIKKIIFESDVIAPANSSSLFYNFNSLENVEGNLDVSNVTNMKSMFEKATQLKTIDVSDWDVSKTKNMSYMFSGANNLKKLDVSEWIVSNVSNMSYMFNGSNNLKELDVSKWNVTNVQNMAFMFNEVRNLEELNVSEWNVSNVVSMSRMFSNANSLENFDPSKWNVSSVKNMERMFFNTSSIVSLNLNKWNVANVTNMNSMFEYANNLESLEVSGWNVGNVTTMSYMFSRTNKLKNLDVSGWDMSQVTNIRFMFSEAVALEFLDVRDWDVSNVQTMTSTFRGAVKLDNLDVSEWDIGNVKNMNYMFSGAIKLNELDVSKWDVSNVSTMMSMFAKTVGLSHLDVSNWDIKNVDNMSHLFNGSSGLKLLDFSKWEPKESLDISNLLSGTNLKYLILGEKFILNGAALPSINTENGFYTGKWLRSEPFLTNDGNTVSYLNSESFEENYDGSLPGTYRWQKYIKIKFEDGFGNSLFDEKIGEGELTPIISTPIKKGYKFLDWDKEIALLATEDMTYVARWEINNPTGEDITTDLNVTPDASEGISNKDDLPEGTEYTWKETPDVSTPGDKPGTVIVEYPDGSSAEVDITITVIDTRTGAEKHDPVENLPLTGMNSHIIAYGMVFMISGLFILILNKNKLEKEI